LNSQFNRDRRTPFICNVKNGYNNNNNNNERDKGKAIPVTGHEDPQGCETLRLPHFL
jgi:hypothetical protein